MPHAHGRIPTHLHTYTHFTRVNPPQHTQTHTHTHTKHTHTHTHYTLSRSAHTRCPHGVDTGEVCERRREGARADLGNVVGLDHCGVHCGHCLLLRVEVNCLAIILHLHTVRLVLRGEDDAVVLQEPPFDPFILFFSNFYSFIFVGRECSRARHFIPLWFIFIFQFFVFVFVGGRGTTWTYI